MKPAKIPLMVATRADGDTVLRAPMVGIWSDPPEEGAAVVPGSPAGALTQLGRRFALFVPEDVSGRVAYETRSRATAPVEFGQPLFRVAPEAASGAPTTSATKAASRAAGGTHSIAAPTDGVYYRSPAAGAPPYVSPGDRIRSGQAVGLIEVMKTFNPIAYAGAGLPDEAVVVEVLATDGQEVRAGQALVIVKIG